MEKIEDLVENTLDKIAQFGEGATEFETKDIERLTKLAKMYLDLDEKIVEHQLDEDNDLITVGELVLTEMGYW